MAQVVKKRLIHYEFWLIAAGLIVLAALVLTEVMREFRLDDSFITYRYARNVARGWGLVYNRGDAILSTTAPLYALLLAALSFVVPDFHTLGGLIGALSIGAGGGLIVALLPPTLPRGIRIWAGVVYVLSLPLWLALGMETALWMTLVLAAAALAQSQRWFAAGFVIGMAILTRPDAALPGVLIGAWAIAASVYPHPTPSLSGREALRFQVFPYALAAAVPVLIFGVWAQATYGSPLPATLGAKEAQAVLGITGFGTFTTVWGGLALIVEGLLNQTVLYVIFVPLMLLGLRRGTTLAVWLIVLWSLLHLGVYAVLGVAPYRWYYAPLVPGVVLLAAHGLDTVYQWLGRLGAGIFRWAAAVLAVSVIWAQTYSFIWVALAMFYGYQTWDAPRTLMPVVDWQVYRQVGEWLNHETPPDSTVGVAEVGQVGFYADRWMTDYLGLLQPEVSAALERGDLYSWLPEHMPDYLVFQRFRGAPLVLYNYRIDGDPWFLATYREAVEFDDPRYAYGPVTIFERVTNKRELFSQPADIGFGPLQLVGVAADGVDLAGMGEPVRVRLDWQVTASLPLRIHIAVAALDAPGDPTSDREYTTTNWRGAFSTWHTLVLPDGLAPGGYPILVSVGEVGKNDYSKQAVGWFDVSFPKMEAAPQASDVFSLNGQPRLWLLKHDAEIQGGALHLHMDWYAGAYLAADFSSYTYFVHVTPPGGGQPLAQADGQPLGGTYPTLLWNEGEVVPLDIAVADLPTTPGAYDVYVGWYIPGAGQRLTTQQNEDSLRLYQLVVSPDGGAIISQVSE